MYHGPIEKWFFGVEFLFFEFFLSIDIYGQINYSMQNLLLYTITKNNWVSKIFLGKKKIFFNSYGHIQKHFLQNINNLNRHEKNPIFYFVRFWQWHLKLKFQIYRLKAYRRSTLLNRIIKRRNLSIPYPVFLGIQLNYSVCYKNKIYR